MQSSWVKLYPMRTDVIMCRNFHLNLAPIKYLLRFYRIPVAKCVGKIVELRIRVRARPSLHPPVDVTFTSIPIGKCVYIRAKNVIARCSLAMHNSGEKLKQLASIGDLREIFILCLTEILRVLL